MSNLAQKVAETIQECGPTTIDVEPTERDHPDAQWIDIARGDDPYRYTWNEVLQQHNAVIVRVDPAVDTTKVGEGTRYWVRNVELTA